MTTDRDRLAALWPTDALRLRTPRLELRPVIESEFPELMDAILAGIHPPEAMPFAMPWTDAPREELIANSLRHFWSQRGAVASQKWSLLFGVRSDASLVGIQEVRSEHFAVTRTVSTGSWLTSAAQGRGIGTEMRAAVLLFAIDHLGADRATSSAFADNAASIVVSERLGYGENGEQVTQRRCGERAVDRQFVLTPATLRRPAWTLAVDGLEGCRHLLV